jgi:omega-6 fatty acid desaturase (delta-12 desaturase)
LSDTLLDAAAVVRRPDARAVAKALAPYAKPSNPRAVFELAVTLIPFIALWAAMAVLVSGGYWIALALAVPAAGFLVRIFMIQHDCGHGSFFGGARANDWTGRALGVMTMTPYSVWKRIHAIHHAGAGCLDHRGFGEIATLTVEEYAALSAWGRLKYRLYRNPAVLFGIGPAYLFILEQRVPVGLLRRGWKPWLSAMGTNLAIALVAGTVIWFTGLWTFLAIHLPVIAIAASAGVWLFYIQHQFEETTWEWLPEWKRQEAALLGSSHYDLPAPLRWLTGNIGVHHVHHLAASIPFYRLPNVLRDLPELREINRMTLLDSLKTIPLTLWDETRHKMISFREFGRMGAAA